MKKTDNARGEETASSLLANYARRLSSIARGASANFRNNAPDAVVWHKTVIRAWRAHSSCSLHLINRKSALNVRFGVAPTINQPGNRALSAPSRYRNRYELVLIELYSESKRKVISRAVFTLVIVLRLCEFYASAASDATIHKYTRVWNRLQYSKPVNDWSN